MTAVGKAIAAGHKAARNLHARHHDGTTGLWNMTADDCLRIVATHLPGSRLDGCTLYVGDQRVASTNGERIKVWHAIVWDGERHYIPKGCGDCVTVPRHHRDPVGRVLRAIEERQAARAKSLPLPVSEGGYDPEEVRNVA